MSYRLFVLIVGVPDDVVATFMIWAERLRYHHLILGQPYLELLVPPPVSVRARLSLAKTKQGLENEK